MNQPEEYIKDEIVRTEEQLNIILPGINKTYQLTSNGRSFYLYEFQFFSVGYTRFPNEIISTTMFLAKNAQIFDYAAIGSDGAGGYFLLKRDKSKKVYFWNGGEILTYAEDSDRFFEGFEYLNSWVNSYIKSQKELNSDYDTLDDPAFANKLDSQYDKVMKYINNEIEQL